MSFRDNWFTAILWKAAHGGVDRYAIARERARLREMSETELSDIGISRREAIDESMRPFWQGRRCH